MNSALSSSSSAPNTQDSRFALLADVHGNLPALEAVIADLRRRGVDQVFHLGDYLSGPLLPLETARFLMEQGGTMIAGNHERQLLDDSGAPLGASDEFTKARLSKREFDWLRSLPATARPRPDVFLCHGTPRSDREYFLESVEDDGRVRPASPEEIETRLGSESARLVVCAHTHIARHVRTADGRRIVNPGSVGLPAYDDVDPAPHAMEAGSPDARYAIVESSADDWSVSMISVPYDHQAMARLAAQNGRPDWSRALSTGFLQQI